MIQRRNKAYRWILWGGIVAALVAILILVIVVWQVKSSPVNKDTYQLVKLTNGEVYFGKLSGLGKEYVTLNDAYMQAPEKDEQARDITIVRLSATVAKPEDTIHIAKSQVVYWENLQHDSKIMSAIQSQQ